jgi:hypothetical protein
MKILTYKKSTGEVRSVVSGKDNIKKTIANLPDGIDYKETTLNSPKGWYVVDGEEVKQEPEKDPKQQRKLRRLAYQQEADPLFFKWQRGESSEAEYKEKILEIKRRYPYDDL